MINNIKNIKSFTTDDEIFRKVMDVNFFSIIK